MSQSLFRLVRSGVDVSSLHVALDDTLHDHHFGKEYRHRSMSRFEVTSNEKGFRQLEAMPLYQSNAINPIENYGGKYRDYMDLPQALLESKAFEDIVRTWLATLPEQCERFSVHHIRTRAPGAPTPEGRHRDGYQYVGIGVLQRDGIASDSAVTKVWDKESDALIFKQILEEGDIVVFDDRRHLHETTDVQTANYAKAGVRDVLIFTVPDHGAIFEGTEIE